MGGVELPITAEDVTGKSWIELVRTNRVIYRYAFACLVCGELDYYGPRDLSPHVRARGHIGSIVHQPTASEAAAYSCNACGAHQLYPLCGQSGCLLGLLQLVGLFRETVTCPKCRTGLLRSEMIGVS